MSEVLFNSILVANRGEIAVRVIRSAKAAGYRTIAVYSEADRYAPHVELADEALLLGPAPVKDSYLNAERIIAAAKRSDAQAIHPGYGFLSENAAFAKACAGAGIVFIGPSPEAIDLMGNKAAAKRHMLAASVPCVPGYQGSAQDNDSLLSAAQAIGAPIMVKAAAGGGGRGMRLVEELADLPSALDAARSEALNAFGSDELILEKAVLEPRHVEIQVFGDSHGKVLHLGERDCSVQRRHQKVVEEAPCPVMTEELRQAMGAAAVAAAESIGYVGAGTVEFLLDASNTFYFLEMNTRLQVEHPVTELVTGLDLVDLQLRVAQGEALPLKQEDVVLRGHAIEVRLYAEDTVNGFLPASGTAEQWSPPAGEGIRVDHGLTSGLLVSPFYDPMIAKVIAYDTHRDGAIRRLRRALENTLLFGVPNNREFLIDVLERDRFTTGAATTAFIEQEFPNGVSAQAADLDTLMLAGLLQFLEQQQINGELRLFADEGFDGSTGVRSLPASFAYQIDDELAQVDVTALGDDRYQVVCGELEKHALLLGLPATGCLRLAWDEHIQNLAFCFRERGFVELQKRGRQFRLRNELAFSAAEREIAGSGSVTAPMHGNVLGLRVAEGDRVCKGDALAVLEAMKMEHTLIAEVDGVVSTIQVEQGQQVSANDLLLTISTAAENDLD
ncbi:MAG: acetyl-CoA carboxylase biotin carboxylase subunit [Pseudomonadota bacterium]